MPRKSLKDIIKREEHENKMKSRGGRSMPRGYVVIAPGEQEATSAISRDSWSHVADVLRTPETSRYARVPREDPP